MRVEFPAIESQWRSRRVVPADSALTQPYPSWPFLAFLDEHGRRAVALPTHLPHSQRHDVRAAQSLGRFQTEAQLLSKLIIDVTSNQTVVWRLIIDVTRAELYVSH